MRRRSLLLVLPLSSPSSPDDEPFCSFIPETKGLSLEQVDLLYRNSSIIKSNSYRKRIMAENLQDETQEGYYAAAQDKNAGRFGHNEHAGKRDFDSDGLVEKRSV